MSFTRSFYDTERVQDTLFTQTGLGRYMLDVPGNGVNMPFIEDPHIRLQKWGANLLPNMTDLNSDLSNVNKKLNRYNLIEESKDYSQQISFRHNNPTIYNVTDESRVLTPAWEILDKETIRWNYLHNNPQENTSIPFENNLSSRIIEKDQFISQSKR